MLRWNVASLAASLLVAFLAPLARAEKMPEAFAVEPAVPGQVADGVVFFRPLAFEHRLSTTIIELLPPVSLHGAAAMVPDHRGRAESNRPAALLDAPANIDIVTGGAELRIESSDGLQ